MSSTFDVLYYHFVFTTKHRQSWLTDDVLTELVPYMGGIARNLDGKLMAGGGLEEHLHLLPSLPPKLSPSDAARTFKANSSRWLKNRFGLRGFAWQTGFGVMSVSKGLVEAVRTYVLTQNERHRRMSLDEELEAISIACGLTPRAAERGKRR